MAKKGAQVQLQADLQTDEEWEKFLTREGLLLVDVYSEWCGPCAAMAANLKKIKLEIGGDFLQLAIAKSDTIGALKRFEGLSEPTWMFIAQGQMVRLLLGANAPALQQAIIDELKKEKDCIAGSRDRMGRLPWELTDNEQKIYDMDVKKGEERERLIVEKAHKQLTDRRTVQAKNILDTMQHMGLVLAFPHCSRKALEVMEPFLKETGLAVSKKERPILTEEALEDIEFFSSYKIPNDSRKVLVGERAFAMVVTNPEEGSGVSIEEAVLALIYGRSGKPPGDPESPAQLLMIHAVQPKEPSAEILEVDEGVEIHEEEKEFVEQAETLQLGKSQLDELNVTEPIPVEEDNEKEDIWGLWAPANELVKATALKYFFPLATAPLILPEPEPIPPHIAIAFDAFKREEVQKISNDFINDVMAYGFFTNENCDEAKLVATTFNAYAKKPHSLFSDKLILKISRKKSDAVLAFAQLGPTYMSNNIVEGEKECAVFFPEDYTNDEEEVLEEKEKKKRRNTRRSYHPTTVAPVVEDLSVIVFESKITGEGAEHMGEEQGSPLTPPPEAFEQSALTSLPPVEEDKATSPMEEIAAPPPMEIPPEPPSIPIETPEETPVAAPVVEAPPETPAEPPPPIPDAPAEPPAE